MKEILYITACYLLGSISCGFILVKTCKGHDVRTIGSHNIGATNVLRTGNKSLAAATFLLDALKGYLAAYIAIKFLSYNPVLFGCAIVSVVLGHMFTIFLKFRGGKGISTTFGVMMCISPIIGVTSLIVWIIVAKLFKVSSIAGLAATITMFICSFINPCYTQIINCDMRIVYGILTLLIFFKHKDNIMRIITGTENTI